MSHTDHEPSRSASAVVQPLAVVTIWVLAFVAVEFLAPAGFSDVVVAGLAGGVAFVASRRYLRARRKNES